MTRAIVLAAGRGSRLTGPGTEPKPLTPVAGRSLIAHVLTRLESAGMTEVVVVVGYRARDIRDALGRRHGGMTVDYVTNSAYSKPNGTSLLAARRCVEGPTVVAMGDHLFDTELLEPIVAFPLGSEESVLGVDTDPTRCFDLADATKVRTRRDRLEAIGKQLDSFDSIDTGVFKVTDALLAELERLDGPDGCSLSRGVQALADRQLMKTVSIGDARWIDVDTPAARARAEKLLSSPRHSTDRLGCREPG